MAYSTLGDFVAALEAAGELHRVSAPVSPLLECTEIVDRVSKSSAARLSSHAPQFDPHHHALGGKAVLFENVEGSSMPLLMNAFGSYRRMEMALGCEEGGFASLAAKIEQLAKPEPPVGLMEKMKKGLELARIAGVSPKVVRSGACQQVVRPGDEVNLFDLPIIKCWPLDGSPTAVGYPDLSPNQGQGRYITFGQMYTLHPDDAGVEGPRPSRNVGMYRAQLLTPNTTAMHWHMHHDGARHWRAWKKRAQSGANRDAGRGMPLAIVFGGQSVLPYAATAPLPPGVSELLFAGFLNGKPIELVACKTIDLHVPANAELVIEGWVSIEASDPSPPPRTLNAGHEVLEGPFGDHTGFYCLPEVYPLFTVTAVTHRRDPIFPATIVGLPPQEDYYMGKATERLFLPLLRTMIPDIVDYDLPLFGAFHHCAFVQIRKEYPLQARRVMHAIWGAGQMAWTKMIVVVDDDVDVHDHEQVLFHLGAHCDPGRDVETVTGPLDILDHAAPVCGAGTKIGFDATRKLPAESARGHAVRDYPERLAMTDQVKRQVDQRWRQFGFDEPVVR